jgi:hypothetical protein
MYEPQYRCDTCDVPMRRDGQCLKCLEPDEDGPEECRPPIDDKLMAEKDARVDWCRCCGEIAILFGEPGMFAGTYCLRCRDKIKRNCLAHKRRKPMHIEPTMANWLARQIIDHALRGSFPNLDEIIGSEDCQKPEPMTVERAVEVLNKFRHKGCPFPNGKFAWVIMGHEGSMIGHHGSGNDPHYLTRMEAIAIAEWYERNPEKPQ